MVDLGRVVGLLPRRAGHPGLAEYLEPRPGIPERPGGQLDLVRAEGVLDPVWVGHRGTWFLVESSADAERVGHGATSVRSVPSSSATARSSGRRSPVPSAQWSELPVALHSPACCPGSQPQCTHPALLPILTNHPAPTRP